MPKKLTTFSMRMPEDINEKVQAYAAEHECTKAEAMSHFARAGIEIEDSGKPASSDELEQIISKINDLATKEDAETTQTTAVIPVDIKDKIQAYSKEHECSENEALGYYARIGIQISDAQRPASVSEVQELSKKLDVLAKDSQTKSEQISKMAETLQSIQKNTEPETVEVEGELADPAIEDAHDAEPTEEEKERQAAERTKKIMTDVMNEYAAAHPTPAPTPPAPQQQQVSPWIPVLVAAIVSLAIGLVVLLLH